MFSLQIGKFYDVGGDGLFLLSDIFLNAHGQVVLRMIWNNENYDYVTGVDDNAIRNWKAGEEI